MKKAIKLVVLVMASAMMMSGCGKEEKISRFGCAGGLW